MGKLVDYRNAPRKSAGTGANSAAITGTDGKNMQADYIKLDLTVDGAKEVGNFGKAAFFPCGNKHDLHGTPGNSYFIEFHIPYNYTTVR